MTTEVTNPRFPVGLRVLVVDDDPLCLRIVEKMLKRCQYEGAAKSLSPRALILRREIDGGRSEGGAANERRARARRRKRATLGKSAEAPVTFGSFAQAWSPRPPTSVPRPWQQPAGFPSVSLSFSPPSVHLAPRGLPVCHFDFYSRAFGRDDG